MAAAVTAALAARSAAALPSSNVIAHPPATPNVVGQVIKGYEVVKAIEACGARSGETSQDVMIGNAGVVKPAGAAATTTASLQQPGAGPRRSKASAAAAVPAGMVGQLKQQRCAVLQGKSVAAARRPRATVVRAAVCSAPVRSMAVLL
jgi:peptidyl-prolyl isomerase F (cyclophilin D)